MKCDLINQDTIAAIATPPGKGGVGIIRISGGNSLKISEKILRKPIKDRIANFARFYDTNDKVIDEGIALFFKGPKSFTGEDVLELQGHGGAFVLDSVLKTVIKLGARLAKPGEFSKRSFLHGKMDLIQAESILSLINAKSEQAVELAFRSLQGTMSKELKNVSDNITKLRIMIESTIDFSEEMDLTIEDGIVLKANSILESLDSIINSLKNKYLFNEDVNIAIVGKPNSGKSSLLNSLAEKNASIVTDIPGTTRDILRENLKIDNIPVVVIDTAGTRYSKFISMENNVDRIERQGIKKIKSAIKDSDVLLILEDTTLDFEEESVERCVSFIEKPYIIIENKIDLIYEIASIFMRNDISAKAKISIKGSSGIDMLKHRLRELAHFVCRQEGGITAKRRYIEALRKCKSAVAESLVNIEEFSTIDLVAEDLKEAQGFISEITGDVTNEDILSNIFQGFCIGK